MQGENKAHCARKHPGNELNHDGTSCMDCVVPENIRTLPTEGFLALHPLPENSG